MLPGEVKADVTSAPAVEPAAASVTAVPCDAETDAAVTTDSASSSTPAAFNAAIPDSTEVAQAKPPIISLN
ncbi:hypothetical protein OfM2_04070 [Lactovum odontotermitis]